MGVQNTSRSRLSIYEMISYDYTCHAILTPTPSPFSEPEHRPWPYKIHQDPVSVSMRWSLMTTRVMQFWTPAPPLHLLDIHVKYQYISTYYAPDKAQYVQKIFDLVNYDIWDKSLICLPQDPIVGVQFTTRKTIYRQVSNISRTESQHLKDYRTVFRLSLPNTLKPDVKSRMKM